MNRRSCLVLCMATAVALVLGPMSEELFAQESLASKIRPGGYLSILKIALIAIVFLTWVKVADWINRDAMRFGDKTGLTPEFWNPIIAFSFLVAFVAVITIPIFWAGFPVYVVAAAAPTLGYILTRKNRLKDNGALARSIKASKGKEHVELQEELPQDEGAELDFSPAGDDKTQKQANLIRARQTGSFDVLKDMLFEAQFKRTDQMLMDYTRGGAAVRILVDGSWHPMPAMDRETGDAVLASMKNLAAMNPAERRAKQTGGFGFKSEHGKAKIEVTSQGVQTGERVLVRFVQAAQGAMQLDRLGMFPDMMKVVKTSMDTAGVTIISSPPGHGFTSSWQGALVTTDRLTRDCIGYRRPDETETDIENIVGKFYDPANGKPQFETLRTILLTQPDMVVVPKVEDKQTMDLLIEQALKQDRSILLKTPALSAAEALLRVYSQAGNRADFLQALKTVTCQRLLRRLCPKCRTEVRVQPQLIQQLGGNPKTQGTVFNPYRLPPPEQRVDEKGDPIEFPPCETCGGIGYIGRIAAFEMISVDDQLRAFIAKNPQAAAIEAAAVKLGKKSMAQQAYQLVLLGVTSLAEVQRVLKNNP